jgi:hypothetical protein
MLKFVHILIIGRLPERRKNTMEEERRGRRPSEDPFNMMMFGSRIKEPEQEEIQQHPTLDYEEIMVNIDKLFESAQNLKPLFSKIYPMIEQLWKKE